MGKSRLMKTGMAALAALGAAFCAGASGIASASANKAEQAAPMARIEEAFIRFEGCRYQRPGNGSSGRVEGVSWRE